MIFLFEAKHIGLTNLCQEKYVFKLKSVFHLRYIFWNHFVLNDSANHNRTGNAVLVKFHRTSFLSKDDILDTLSILSVKRRPFLEIIEPDLYDPYI